jgi:hypothetical protein
MQMEAELVRERTRSQLQEAAEAHTVRRLRALTRARRNERKAERRLMAAWRARSELEAALGTE